MMELEQKSKFVGKGWHHLRFLKDYSSLKKFFEEDGNFPVIITATKKQLVNRLIDHITAVDKKYLKLVA